MSRFLRHFAPIFLGFLLFAAQIPHLHDHHDEFEPNSAHDCHVCKIQNHLSASPPDVDSSISFIAHFESLVLLDSDVRSQAIFQTSTSSRAPPIIS